PDLFVAADHGIDLVLARERRQVPAVAFERLIFDFGILVRDALAASHAGERRQYLFLDGTGGFELRGGFRAARSIGDREQEVFSRNEFVFEGESLFAGTRQEVA